jgi:hypothetical protein
MLICLEKCKKHGIYPVRKCVVYKEKDIQDKIYASVHLCPECPVPKKYVGVYDTWEQALKNKQ